MAARKRPVLGLGISEVQVLCEVLDWAIDSAVSSGVSHERLELELALVNTQVGGERTLTGRRSGVCCGQEFASVRGNTPYCRFL